MAIKVNGKVSTRVKAKRERNPMMLDEKYTGPEPIWDAERALKMTDDDFYHHMRLSLNWCNYYFNQKDMKKWVIQWMKDQPKLYKDKDIKAFMRANANAMPITVYSLVRSHVNKGMPFRGRMLEYITGNIAKAIAGADPEVIEEAKPDAPKKPNIQDYINEKTAGHLGEFEGAYDDVIKNKESTFKAFDYLTTNNVAQAQLDKFKTIFTAHLTEAAAALKKKDPLMVEGYKHCKIADLKRMILFLGQALADIEQYRAVKKTTKKVRKARPVSKEKLIKRLKYAKENKLLKLISINPADIIGATELFSYDSKKRKLTWYIGAAYNTLSVKGTSITQFDEGKSITKTLRKPEDQLKAFMKCGKVELRTFMTKIKAVPTVPTGRTNADTLLLKVI